MRIGPAESRAHLVVAAVLVLVALAAAAYKLLALDYSLADIMPRARYDVVVDLRFDGLGRDVNVHTFLPASDARQEVSDEQNASPGLNLVSQTARLNRAVTWSGNDVGADARIRYSFAVMSRPVRFELEPGLALPAAYPQSVISYLQPEKAIQVDDLEIRTELARINANTGTLNARLQAIYARTAAMPQRPFKGTTDALTALRLGEASCNGKSRLFVALARATGIPARLVGGLVMQEGARRTTHQWVEAYVAGHWVPFDPTNRHFAELPQHYLSLYTGDEVLFSHTKDINFDYRFTVTKTLVPSPQVKQAFSLFNIWAMFERLGLPFTLLRTILMLPVGALIVVLFRNVVGMPTFGTFLPALIAAAAGETGALWGVVGVVLIVLAVTVVRWVLHRLKLLHSPTLAIGLAAVTVTLLATAFAAEQLALPHLTRVTLFPIAVMAITAERFYLALTEQGTRAAAKQLGGTLIVILACYAVMSSIALQVLLIGFPEVLLVVVALDIYLGRWVGVRLSEYLRFRGLVLGGAKA